MTASEPRVRMVRDPHLGQVWLRNRVRLRVAEIGDGWVRLEHVENPLCNYYVPRARWAAAELIFVGSDPRLPDN